MEEIIKTIVDRWTSESPKLFKYITNICIILGTAAFGLTSADKLFDLQQIGVPAIIFTIDGYVLAVCGAMGLTSKITKV